MKRKAEATWKGGKSGKGILTTPSTVLNETPYNLKERFEAEDGKAGTNPEELIGAAHAGCFSMALSVELEKAGFEADTLNTKAVVSIDPVDGGFSITNITLNLTGKVPGISEDKFKEIANGAKKGCPVSKALNAVPIDLNITFES